MAIEQLILTSKSSPSELSEYKLAICCLFFVRGLQDDGPGRLSLEPPAEGGRLTSVLVVAVGLMTGAAHRPVQHPWPPSGPHLQAVWKTIRRQDGETGEAGCLGPVPPSGAGSPVRAPTLSKIIWGSSWDSGTTAPVVRGCSLVGVPASAVLSSALHLMLVEQVAKAEMDGGCGETRQRMEVWWIGGQWLLDYLKMSATTATFGG
uniref:Uncharacterized protein n=1 Tax=Branchiostoma floridae TaxID=7739 RepID=C3Y874_BRAFL|eukprot:XP_002607533.1 hypothetical protein BRAFLDRAFT_106481 [Branchiostoma floridae]